MVFVFFLIGLFENYRVWYFLFLVCVPALTRFYCALSFAKKRLFLVFVVVVGVFQFLVWFNYKLSCFPLQG